MKGDSSENEAAGSAGVPTLAVLLASVIVGVLADIVFHFAFKQPNSSASFARYAGAIVFDTTAPISAYGYFPFGVHWQDLLVGLGGAVNCLLTGICFRTRGLRGVGRLLLCLYAPFVLIAILSRMRQIAGGSALESLSIAVVLLTLADIARMAAKPPLRPARRALTSGSSGSSTTANSARSKRPT